MVRGVDRFSNVQSLKTDMQILPVTRPPVRKSAAGGAPLAGIPAPDLSAGGAHRTGAKTAPLGTNAKYDAKPMATRVQRFALQSSARAIIPTSRTAKCLRIRAYNSNVEVWKSCEFGTAQYAGLQTCGSVWACPVCAAKIAERRRVEVLAAMTAHKAAGGCMNLLTLTTPHQRKDNLADLLAMQAKAIKAFWTHRSVRAVFAEMGAIGQIRALEVTHGRKSEHNNGWHPHYHVLLFCGVGVDLARFDEAQMKDWAVRLYLRWAACCVKAGLGEPSFKHGLKLDNGEKAAHYVTKWGLEDEMTKGHTKKALHGETPFDFLRAYLADKNDKQAAALFKEFAETFKGKRQLHWSKGLKARYAIEESTDEQLSTKIEERAVFLGAFTVDQWRDVLKVDARGVVLELAAKSGWSAVQSYLHFIAGAAKDTQFEPGMLDEVRAMLLTFEDWKTPTP